ncbi:acyl carrier protein [Streptomyces sp. NPDC006923]|uniref:acyl carrier protein n=1 Tax=Streptomyces sp. NPDC006923 TaxID=3155355 RepID=UPI0033C2310C
MSPEPTAWTSRLAATPLSERGTLLEELVVTEFRTALLMGDDDELPRDESYFAHGLTSLGATEIEQRLEAVLGRPIDAASLLNNPTIDHLLTHLRTDVLADHFPVAGREPQGPAEPSGPQATTRALVDDMMKSLYAS